MGFFYHKFPDKARDFAGAGSARVVQDRESGEMVFQLSVPDMKAEAAYPERLAGEVLKGPEKIKNYRDLLEKCLGR